jgi:hypothetical protein
METFQLFQVILMEQFSVALQIILGLFMNGYVLQQVAMIINVILMQEWEW